MYGCETWAILKYLYSHLDAFDMWASFLSWERADQPLSTEAVDTVGPMHIPSATGHESLFVAVANCKRIDGSTLCSSSGCMRYAPKVMLQKWSMPTLPSSRGFRILSMSQTWSRRNHQLFAALLQKSAALRPHSSQSQLTSQGSSTSSLSSYLAIIVRLEVANR